MVCKCYLNFQKATVTPIVNESEDPPSTPPPLLRHPGPVGLSHELYPLPVPQAPRAWQMLP